MENVIKVILFLESTFTFFYMQGIKPKGQYIDMKLQTSKFIKFSKFRSDIFEILFYLKLKNTVNFLIQKSLCQYFHSRLKIDMKAKRQLRIHYRNKNQMKSLARRSFNAQLRFCSYLHCASAFNQLHIYSFKS